MPKLKTNKAAKKRYKYTATGKVKRTKSNRRQMLMLIKHVKQELKDYYHMVTKK